MLPHDPPRQVTDDILTVVGEIEMPLMTLPRRMTVVRLKDGRLVIFSAIALDEAEMRRLEDFGTPAFLIVPSDHHRMDAKIWKDRYPALEVVAPPGAREAVEEAVPVDATEGDFGDPSVRLVIVPGTGGREAALEVRRPGGLTLVINDVIGNIRDAKGFGGWLLKRMGFAGDEPHLPGAGPAQHGRGQEGAARPVPRLGERSGLAAHPRLARRRRSTEDPQGGAQGAGGSARLIVPSSVLDVPPMFAIWPTRRQIGTLTGDRPLHLRRTGCRLRETRRGEPGALQQPNPPGFWRASSLGSHSLIRDCPQLGVGHVQRSTQRVPTSSNSRCGAISSEALSEPAAG